MARELHTYLQFSEHPPPPFHMGICQFRPTHTHSNEYEVRGVKKTYMAKRQRFQDYKQVYQILLNKNAIAVVHLLGAV